MFEFVSLKQVAAQGTIQYETLRGDGIARKDDAARADWREAGQGLYGIVSYSTIPHDTAQIDDDAQAVSWRDKLDDENHSFVRSAGRSRGTYFRKLEHACVDLRLVQYHTVPYMFL